MLDVAWVEATRTILAKQHDHQRAVDEHLASSRALIGECQKVLRQTEHLITAKRDRS